jgi:hypothetical protein
MEQGDQGDLWGRGSMSMAYLSQSARWGGTCIDCGCKIPQHSTAYYIPADRLHPKGAIKHIAGQCGSAYVVHAIYAVTRKQIKVLAYSADEAIEIASKSKHCRGQLKGLSSMVTGGATAARPQAWEVWQGNVRVR